MTRFSLAELVAEYAELLEFVRPLLLRALSSSNTPTSGQKAYDVRPLLLILLSLEADLLVAFQRETDDVHHSQTKSERPQICTWRAREGTGGRAE